MPHTHHRLGLIALLLSTLLCLPAAGCRKKGAKAYNQGQNHLKKKRYSKAVSSFEKATKQNPNFGEAYYNLGAARYHLAATRLNALVASNATPALRAALKTAAGTPAKEGVLVADPAAALSALKQELGRLPGAEADAIVALLRKSLQAKLKSLELFKKGKFEVIRKSSTRQAMIGKLDRVVKLRALLRKGGEQDRGLWLTAIARPTLLAPPVAPRPRPRPTGAKKQ